GGAYGWWSWGSPRGRCGAVPRNGWCGWSGRRAARTGIRGPRGRGVPSAAAPGQDELLGGGQDPGQQGADDADDHQTHVQLLRHEQLPGVPDQVAQASVVAPVNSTAVITTT